MKSKALSNEGKLLLRKQSVIETINDKLNSIFIASVLQYGDIIEYVSPVCGQTVVNAYRYSLIFCCFTIARSEPATQHFLT